MRKGLWVALGAICSVLLATLPGGATQLAPDVATSHLGFCFVYHDRPVWHQLAQESGAQLNRWQLSWYEVERVKGQFDWAKFDSRVAEDNASGLAVSAILMGTPDWAATQGTKLAPLIRAEVKEEPWTIKQMGQASTSASPPVNLYLPWDHPNNYWGRFVYRTVSYFKGRIKIWEIWNEPDWNFFWTGSAADYYQLLKVGYQAAKAADPESTVIFGGLFLFSNPDFFQQVLELARQDPTAPAHNYYFDAMPVHLYSNSAQPYDNVAWLRWRMGLKGIYKPIWINETGAPVWNDGVGPGYQYEWSVTADEQAAYLVQAYANALAAGVENFFVFRLHDAGMGEAYGLVRDDLSRRPAFETFKLINTYLRDPAWTTRRRSGGVVVVTLYGTPKGKVTVLWNEQPTAGSYALPAIMGTALRLDKTGRAQTIIAQNGQYLLTLPGATASLPSNRNTYIVGGDPLIIVEPDTVAPQVRFDPLPAQIAQTAFVLRWSGADDASGILSYDVQVRDGPTGAWSDWLSWTSLTSATFSGLDGHTYYFRVRARDQAGNTGSYPDQPQTWTTIRLPTPTATPIPTATPTPSPTPTTIPTPTPTWTSTPVPPDRPTPTNTPAVRPCVELLPNGGFETESDWFVFNTAYPAGWVSAPVRSGARALRTGIDNPTLNVYTYSSVEQTLTLPADASDITLSYWYLASQIDDGDYGYVFMRPQNAGWNLLHVIRQSTTAWTPGIYDLAPYAGQTITLRVGTFNNGRDNRSWTYFDDLSILACQAGPALPTPTAIAPTATATATPTPTATDTPTPTPTSTPTATPVPTATATPTPTPTATPTEMPTPTATATFTPTATPTETPTPTATTAPTPTLSPCVEIAVNGNFEGNEGWEIANTPYKARYTQTVVYGGRQSMQLGIDDPAQNQFSYSSVEQRFVLPAGAKAMLRWWYTLPQSGGSGDYGYFLLRPDGGSWRIIRIVSERTDGWVPIELDVSHYAGQAFTLRLGMRNDGSADGTWAVMYVDDLSLQACR